MRTRTGEDLTIGEVREREAMFDRVEQAARDYYDPATAAALRELVTLLKPLVLPIETPA